MNNTELFKKNLKQWGRLQSKDTDEIAAIECKRVSFCQNSNGDLNLQIKKDHTVDYVYSRESIAEEAASWFTPINLRNLSLLYVYGVGLGNYYQAAKKWLEENQGRRLVFLEDDPEVLRLFLETEMASTLLHDRQASLYYLKWDNSIALFHQLPYRAVGQEYYISPLAYYLKEKNQQFLQIRNQFGYQVNAGTIFATEYLNYKSGFLSNYYCNLLFLPKAALGNALLNKFKNMPAIVCGAGPSLEKNCALLKTLSDRAIIFAGGTALNALNAQGILPHFGVGIDPNPTHETRLLANKSFELPFFYRNRICHEACEAIHGKRLFITGGGGYQLPKWVEQGLGIERSEEIIEGHNVINFNLSIAYAMGCNPIIVVGVDLAYSNNHSYSPGIVSHAIHDLKDDFRTKSEKEEVLIKQDIYGKPVHTLWKWIHESFWFSNFAKQHPNAQFYNATEGGIGFLGIQNVSLAEVKERHLLHQFDFESQIHAEIQEAAMPLSVNFENIKLRLNEIAKSFLNCLQTCEKILEIFYESFQKMVSEEEIISTSLNEKGAPLINELRQELCYQHVVGEFSHNYDLIFKELFQEELDDEFDSPKKIARIKVDQEIRKYKYLLDVMKLNGQFIQNALNAVSKKIKESENEIPQNTKQCLEKLKSEREKNQLQEEYLFENLSLTIIDPELGISLKEPFQNSLLQPINLSDAVWKGKCVCYHSNGILKSEQFYLNNLLHGPSTFYSDKEILLAKSWFVQGKREGKSHFYYLDGSLYSIQRFKDGVWDGKQEFYYENGLPKTLMDYRHGVLDGDVWLYHENGALKRELHFSQGNRHGIEKIWDSDQIIVIEAEYQHDKPIGTARQWHKNGNFAKDILYDEKSKIVRMRSWDVGGNPILVKGEEDDFFDRVTSQTEKLTESLEVVYDGLNKMVPFLKGAGDQKLLEGNLRILKSQFEHMRQVESDLVYASGKSSETQEEAFWKSDASQRGLQHQLEQVTKNMSKDIQNISQLLATTMAALEKKNSKT